MDFQTRYEFNPQTDFLGKGGFSKVYKANDILLERVVALKFFTSDVSDKYQVLNEIKKVIRFEHPNLCKYYDVAVLSSKNIVGETERTEVGIMEYLDAGDFKLFVKNNPQYTDKLLIDVCKGLAYLHRQGIVHRDLKPQNILIKMVEDEPVAKITDFGISKVVGSEDNNSSALMGTIEYMAPEQFNPKKYGVDGKITTNLDIWSFGLLVYETIADHPMFGSRSTGTSAEQVMSNILSDVPLEKTDELPPKYREIVKRCLVKNAADRVKIATDLIPLFEGKEFHAAGGVKPANSGPVVISTAAEQSENSEETLVIKRPAVESGGDETMLLQDLVKNVEEQEETEQPVSQPALNNIKGGFKRRLLWIGLPVILLGGAAAFMMMKPTKKTQEKAPFSAAPITVNIAGGEFIQGSDFENATDDEKPAHKVSVGSFEMGIHEVTMGEFRQFINATGYTTSAELEGFSSVYVQDSGWAKRSQVNWRHDTRGYLIDSTVNDFPVVHVSWFDAVRYCEWLSAQSGEKYRLPTESEWEFAAKGGTKSGSFTFSGGNTLDSVGWFGGNSGNNIHAVGQKMANELGIFDMSGNVMEWCADWFDGDYYKSSPAANPVGPGIGEHRVVRSGSWFYQADICSSTYRIGLSPNGRGGNVGFRICRHAL